MAKTYANLKSDVAAFMHRGDLTATIPTFVYLAEDEIFKSHASPLRVREMETEATVTLTSNVGSLPADYLEARYVRMEGSSDVTYRYMAPELWTENHSGFFTVVGSELRFPTTASGTCKLVYWAMPSRLTNDADTNDILDNYYGAYLNATLKQAAVFTKNIPAAQGYQQLLDFEMMNASKKNGNAFGPLVVKAA